VPRPGEHSDQINSTSSGAPEKKIKEPKKRKRSEVTVFKRGDLLSSDGFDRVAMNVREAEVAALKAIGQPFVSGRAMQDGGIEIVNMDGVFHHM